MNNHNKNKSHSMLWMMIPCLFLLGFLFLGGGKLSGGEYLGPILIGVFVIACVWMMFRGHGVHGSEKEDTDNKNQ